MVATKAKFKVGDRVKYGDAYCDSGVGLIMAPNGDDDWFVKVEERHKRHAHFDGGTTRVFDEFNLEPVAVAPQPQPVDDKLTIRAGAYYRTRDGRKVGPMVMNRTGLGWTADDGRRCYKDNGERVYGDDDGTVIIAEWVDEPVVAVAVAETKFKVGDRVAFVDGYGGFSRGKEATVIKVGAWGNNNGIQVDQGGRYDISTEHAHSLRLVAPATSGKRETMGDILAAALATPKKPAIVALIENGQPLPSTRPFVHPDRDAAAKEAHRLAGKHNGQEFGVYELVDTVKEAKVYEHEWQRLAAGGYRVRAICQLRDDAGLNYDGAATAVAHWLQGQAV